VARSTGRCKDNDVASTHADLLGNLDKEFLQEWRYFCGTVLVTRRCEFGFLHHQHQARKLMIRLPCGLVALGNCGYADLPCFSDWEPVNRTQNLRYFAHGWQISGFLENAVGMNCAENDSLVPLALHRCEC